MSFQIVLSESDLRKMDQVLRDKLLKWYFDQDRTAPPPLPPSSDLGTINVPPDQGGRVSFPELMRAELLPQGTELFCMALKRQKRSGAKTSFEAGKVVADGSVDYQRQHYETPSKLAIAVINANGGKTKAINGYKYLFVHESNKIVMLQELRNRFFKQHS